MENARTVKSIQLPSRHLNENVHIPTSPQNQPVFLLSVAALMCSVLLNICPNIIVLFVATKKIPLENYTTVVHNESLR